MDKFLQIVVLRLKSQSPVFFKRIRKFCAALGAACISVLVAKNFLAFVDFDLPKIMITILGYTICTCAAVTGTTFLTTTDKSIMNKGDGEVKEDVK